MILHTFNVFGSKDGAEEILTTIDGKKCQFLPKSESQTN